MRTKKAKKKEPKSTSFRLPMAEGVGFEPT